MSCKKCHTRHQGPCPPPPPGAAKAGTMHPGPCCAECGALQREGKMRYGAVCDPCAPKTQDLSWVTPPDLSVDELCAFVDRSYGAGQDDASALAYSYLTANYGKTSSGVAVRWSQLPATAHPCLASFKRLIGALVQQRLCELRSSDAQAEYALYNSEAAQ